MRENLTLLTDSYKLGHWRMIPKDTRHVYSYFQARLGSPDVQFQETVWAGLQAIMMEYLIGIRVSLSDIIEGEEFCKAHFGVDGMYNRAMWRHIIDVHGGRLPIEIKAVPEGTPVPHDNVLMTITNTDPLCAPLVNHLETLLCHVWYPCNVATLSRNVKKAYRGALSMSSEKMEPITFMLHDFGMRGSTSIQSAGIGGMAHLINFAGTDTTKGILDAQKYYNAGMAGFSVPATEHSVMTIRGRIGELDVVREVIKEFPTGILSVVSDSYNIYDACRAYTSSLKADILARDGVFVVRPDSGNPVEVVLKCLEILGEGFGTTDNAKGYKVLHPKVRMIWGDGVDFEDINKVLANMVGNKWSAENIVFGMGGGLLQKHNRDSQRFAFKASAVNIGGVWHDVYKDPVHGSKASKKGRMKLVKVAANHGRSFAYETVDISDPRADELVTVFRDGELVRKFNFKELRENAQL